MPGSNCVIVGCTATKVKNRGLTFHRLPTKRPEWRQNLLKVIKSTRADPINEKHLSICSRHFESDCFIEQVSVTGKVRRLVKPGSLPTLHMPVKSIVTPKPPSRPPPKIRSTNTSTSISTNEQIVDFETLLNFSKLPEDWFINKKTDNLCELFKMKNGRIIYLLRIEASLNCELYINNYFVPNFKLQRSIFSSVSKLISYLECLTFCSGVTTEKLQDFGNLIPNNNDNCFRHVELNMNNEDNKIKYNSCVRSLNCKSLIKSKDGMCVNCKQVERNLQRKYDRLHKKRKPIISKKTPLYKVSKAVISKAFKDSRRAVKELKKQLSTIKKKISKEEIIINSNELHNSLYNVLESNTLQDPFMKLFWTEQKSAFYKQDHGHRWHPMMIRLAILLHSQSPAAYRSLRDIGILKLPGESTLRDFTNYIKPSPGFQQEVLLEIKEAADKLPENQRWVTLLHDEMSIKSDLVFDKQTGNVVGFLNKVGKSDTLKNCIATHCLVFMIVGVNSNLKYSLAWFPTTSASSSDLYPLFWEAVCYLETYCNLKVIAATSDKASANMQFFSIHNETEEITNKTVNLFAPNRYIYFFSDAPHLIKTIRNNMADCRGTSRHLWKDGHYILWQHIKDIFVHDTERELNRPTKLTHAHIHLNSFSVMKVNLAAQVLSHSVGKVLEAYGGQEAQETSKFILLVDRFFDCLNIRSFGEGIRKRKPDLEPLRSVDDDRFKFLLDEFLVYIEEWKRQVENREGFTKAERSKMFLTHQTYKGIVITTKSAVEASKYLLEQGVDFVMTNKFCQDPLEEHFGRHRALGRRCDNPTVNEFGYQENKLRLQRTLSLQIRPRGNIKRKSKSFIAIDNTPLKKRKQIKSSQ